MIFFQKNVKNSNIFTIATSTTSTTTTTTTTTFPLTSKIINKLIIYDLINNLLIKCLMK